MYEVKYVEQARAGVDQQVHVTYSLFFHGDGWGPVIIKERLLLVHVLFPFFFPFLRPFLARFPSEARQQNKKIRGKKVMWRKDASVLCWLSFMCIYIFFLVFL